MSISLAIRNIRSVFDDWRRECRIRRLVWTMNCLHLLGWRVGLRSAGVQTGGPAPFNAADKQRFANALDKWLVKGKL